MPTSLPQSVGSPASRAASPDFRMTAYRDPAVLSDTSRAIGASPAEAAATLSEDVGKKTAAQVPLSRWCPLVGAAGLLLRSVDGKEPTQLEQRVARIVSNKRISELYLSWMPWQQSALLAGILDRCPTDQLTMIHKAVGRPLFDPIESATMGGGGLARDSRHMHDAQSHRAKRLQQELSLAIDAVLNHRKSWKTVYAQRQRKKQIASAAEQLYHPRTDMYHYVDPAKYSSHIERALRNLLRQSGVAFTRGRSTGSAVGASGTMPKRVAAASSLASADRKLPSMTGPQASSKPAAGRAPSASLDGDEAQITEGALMHPAEVQVALSADSSSIVAPVVCSEITQSSTSDAACALAPSATSAPFAVAAMPPATYCDSRREPGYETAIDRKHSGALSSDSPALEGDAGVAPSTGGGGSSPINRSSGGVGQAEIRPTGHLSGPSRMSGTEADLSTETAMQPSVRLALHHLRVDGDSAQHDNSVGALASPCVLDAPEHSSSTNDIITEEQQLELAKQRLEKYTENESSVLSTAVGESESDNNRDPTIGRISSDVMAAVMRSGCLQASDEVIAEIVAETLLTTAADVGLFDDLPDQLSPATARQIRERLSGDVVQAVLRHRHIYVTQQDQMAEQLNGKQQPLQRKPRQQRQRRAPAKTDSGKRVGGGSNRVLMVKHVAGQQSAIATDRLLQLRRVAKLGAFEPPNVTASHLSVVHVTPATPEPSLTTVASSKHSITTVDFFPERPLQRYGGLCRGVGSAASDTSTTMDASIPLQTAYKSVKFSYGINDEFLVKPNRRKLTAVYQSQLQDIWQAIEKWRPSDIMTLVVDLVKVSSDDVLGTLRTELSAKCRLARNINDLPDRLLLHIFRFLKPEEIENARKVCQQWHYLCNRPELWMQKCDELGWKLGVSRLSAKLRDEAVAGGTTGAAAAGIDWKLCFYELERLAQRRSLSAGVSSVPGILTPVVSESPAAIKVVHASAKRQQRQTLAPKTREAAAAILDASFAATMAAVAASVAVTASPETGALPDNGSTNGVPKSADRRNAHFNAMSSGGEVDASVPRKRRLARLRLTPVYIEPLSKMEERPPPPCHDEAAADARVSASGRSGELRGDRTSEVSRRGRRRGTAGSSPHRVTIAAKIGAAEVNDWRDVAEAEAELLADEDEEVPDRDDEKYNEQGEERMEEQRRQLPGKVQSRLRALQDTSDWTRSTFRRDSAAARHPALGDNSGPRTKVAGRPGNNGDGEMFRDPDAVDATAGAEVLVAPLPAKGAAAAAVATVSTAAAEAAETRAVAEAAAVDGAALAQAEPTNARNLSSVSRIGIEVLAKKKIMLQADEVALDIRTTLKPIRNLMDGNAGAQRDTDSPALEWGHPDTCNLRDPAVLKRCKAIVKEVNSVRRFQGHLDAINCVAIDKRRAFTGSADHVIFMWDLRSGELVRQLLGHTGSVRCLQLDAGRNTLYSGSWDESIIVWDVVKFKSTALLLGHEGVVTCLKLNADATVLVSASTDSTVRVWSTITYSCQWLLTSSLSSAAIGCLWFDGSLLAAGGDEGVLRVYDFAAKALHKEYRCAEAAADANRVDDQRWQPQPSAEGSKPRAVTSVTIVGDLVAAGLSSGELHCWDRRTAELVARFVLHRSTIVATAFCYGRLLTAGSDGLVKEWELGTMTCVRVLRGHMSAIRAMEVREKDDRIVTVGDDKLVHVWDLREHRKPPAVAATAAGLAADAALRKTAPAIGQQGAVVGGEQAFQTWLPVSAGGGGRK